MGIGSGKNNRRLTPKAVLQRVCDKQTLETAVGKDILTYPWCKAETALFWEGRIFMTKVFEDLLLETQILDLQKSVEEWAIRRNSWHDCRFSSQFEITEHESSADPVVCVLDFGVELGDEVFGKGGAGFEKLVESHGFNFRLDDGPIFVDEFRNGPILKFFPNLGDRHKSFKDYLHWKWICSLIQPDFSDIYDELYDYFASCPDRLHRLSWREFETLLACIFQAQGFSTELGPGRGDGGVDVRFLQRDPIGDILTLVQAKKYAPKNRIGLEAVAALSGIAGVEKAQRSLFVTTSSYQPAARKFAARTSGALTLCTSDDVAQWCETARNGIVADKSTLLSRSSIEKMLLEVREKTDSRVLRADDNFDGMSNTFALLLKETKHAALLMALPKMRVSGDDRYGEEVPRLDADSLLMHKADTVWRAKRLTGEWANPRYWDGRNMYSIWGGHPVMFDFRSEAEQISEMDHIDCYYGDIPF